MPSTYSPLLRLELMATGEKSATWGDITNTNLGTLLEKSIAGTASVNVTAGNVTLTALNGTDDESRCAIINITGTPGVSRNVVAPSTSKTYSVINGSNAAVVFKGAATTGVTLAAGERAWLSWNGSDFVRIGISPEAPVFTGQLSAPLGSAGAPTYSFTGDLNTGIYSGGADQLNVAIGGVQRVVFSSTGLITVSAAASDAVFALQAISFARDWRLKVMNSDGSFRLRDETGGADRLLVDISGNVGFGVVPSGFKLDFGTAGTGTVGGVSNIGGYSDSGAYTIWAGRSAVNGGYVQLYGGSHATNPGLIVLGSTTGPAVYVSAARNVGIGAAPASGWRAGAVALQAGAFLTAWTQSNGSANIGFGLYEGGTNTFNYLTTGDAPTLYSQLSGNHVWYRAAAGAAGGAVTLSENGRFDESGRLRLNGASGFGGVPLAVKVGTNQQFGVLSATIGGTPTTTLCALTDAGVSAPALLTGSPLKLSGDGGSTEHVAISSAGQLYTGSIHNNSSGASGTSPMIASGTYTPTITNVSHLASSTAFACQWIRVGNVVHVSGNVTLAGDSNSTLTEARMSLPISSALTANNNLGGAGAEILAAAGLSMAICARATSDDADLFFTPLDTSSHTFAFSFTYVVL